MAGKGKIGSGVAHGGRSSTGGKGVAYRTETGGTRGVGRRRNRKIVKDSIRAITKGDIRRLARRGGVKRISAPIYDEIRAALKDHLSLILKDCTIFLENSYVARKTVTVDDVIFALKRRGRPIYGFGNGYTLARPTPKKKTRYRAAAAADDDDE